MQVLSFSEKGRRSENEDFVLSKILNEDTSVHIIADGMGGYDYGALASETVASACSQYIIDHLGDTKDFERLIKTSVQHANQELQKVRLDRHSRMGTTICGGLIIKDKAFCFWLGDSRIYHLRRNKLVFASRDHSYVNELLDKGYQLGYYEVLQYRHIIAKSLMGEPQDVTPDIYVIPEVADDDTIILCSDGIHNVVEPAEMEMMLQSSDVLSFVDQIKQKCETEGSDNYSMIILTKVKVHHWT